MVTRIALVALGLAVVSAPSLTAGERAAKKEARQEDKQEDKRAKLDAMAKESLDRLFAASERAKSLHEKSVGYAVFDNTKVSLGLTGGGGTGVAVDEKTGAKTYMKMATGGVNLGLGAQSYRLIFLFQDPVRFQNFVEKGWEADAGANAVAGKAGANAEADFRDGMATYTLTDAGLMLQFDLSGTKYWKNDKLN